MPSSFINPSYASRLIIIDSHIHSLRSILAEAVTLANEACDHIDHDNRSAAVGTIVPIADLLSAATAIHTTILFLNKQRD